MDVCTIIAKNYVAAARVLARSFTAQHPDDRFHVLVIDDHEGWIDPAQEPFELVKPEQLDIPAFERMAVFYDVLELSTAVKPWLLRWLLARSAEEAVVYLDPDMRLYAPLDDMFARVREHRLVLNPHNIEPMPRDGKLPREQDILNAGMFNLGFIGIGSGDFADELLDWWSERLESDCIVDPARGYFVDQRWIDFIPGLAETFHILRDPGFNVAYWNLPTRPVSQREGTWYVKGDVPLRLFHFSGYDARKPHLLSKHQNRIRLSSEPELARLCAEYANELRAAGVEKARDWPYTYTHTASGLPLDNLVRRLYRELALEGFNGSLFDPEGEAAFYEAARSPAESGGSAGVSRLLLKVYELRPDLQQAYPDIEGAGGVELVRWAHRHAATELGLPEALVPQPPTRRDQPIMPVGAVTAPPVPMPPHRHHGVNVAGYLNAETGVGQVARQAIAALDAVGVPVAPVGLHAVGSRHGHAFATVSPGPDGYPINLVCVNADVLGNFVRDAGPRFFADRYTVGWWWWEVQAFPERYHGSFEHVDEVWAGSRFVAETLAAVAPVPVLRMPTPVTFDVWPGPARTELGLPDGHLVLFTWDYHSVFERKNPLGALEAFLRAFPDPEEGATLVLKSINGDLHPDEHERLRLAAAGAPHVRLLDDYLGPADKNRLLASCDCYLSLHRSEGFGFGMAEAMLLRKPVVATGYSGNLDYMTAANSYLVDHTLVAVGPAAAPYPSDGEWAEPDLEHAAAELRAVFERPDEAAARGAQAANDIAREHSSQAAGRAIAQRLGTVAAGFEPASTASLEIAAGGLIGRNGQPARSGSGRGAARRVALRLMRPHTAHQEQVDRALVDDLGQLATRLERLAAERAASQLELGTIVMHHLRDFERRIGQNSPRQGGDLAGQIDALASEAAAQREALQAAGLLGVLPPAVGDAYAPVDAEPWSHEYNDRHRAFVARELEDAELLHTFRSGAALPAHFGVGLDERVVEFPWVASQPLAGAVLDAGSSLNHLHVLQRLRPRCDTLDIVTLAPEPASFPQLGISYLYADLRELPQRDDHYDHIVCISTLEHVGMHVEHFGAEAAVEADPQTELERAVRELRRVLKPGGELYLTLPVGRGERYDWVRTLTHPELDATVAAFAPREQDSAFFLYGADGWQRVERDATAEAHYRDHLTAGPPAADRGVAAYAVACLRLVK